MIAPRAQVLSSDPYMTDILPFDYGQAAVGSPDQQQRDHDGPHASQ